VSTFTGGPLVCNASLVKACCGMYVMDSVDKIEWLEPKAGAF
jgi:hypothetical protein